MTYQQQTVVVAAVTTAHGLSSFYFFYAAAVMITAVAMVSLVEMTAADVPETIAHGSLSSYSFCAAVEMAETTVADVDADSCSNAVRGPFRSPFLFHKGIISV